jgi:hypothetical protein
MISRMRDDKISFNNSSFDWKESVKYLGIVLDSKLTFKNHIEYAIQKASNVCYSSLYCLLKRKSPVSLDSKLRLYKSVVRPILSYGCPVFVNAANCHLKKLQLFQNKILRMIHDVNWDDFKSNEEIHTISKVPFLATFFDKLSNNFYARVSNHSNELFSNLGQYDKDSLTFRLKHKLPKLI